MTDSTKQYGFVAPVIEDDHYVLGASKLPAEVLAPTGSWADCLPADELQERVIETYNCSSYGTLHAIAIYFARALGQKNRNFSERFTGTCAGTRPPGNNPHTVAESIRACGLIDETLWPFDDTIASIDEYFSLAPKEQELRGRGRTWLEIYEFGHEWVFKGTVPLAEKLAKIKEALRYSPVGASVYAWRSNGTYYTKPAGEDDNHWIVIYDYVEGEYWMIFDSYDQTHKKLAWEYDFGFAKRYYVKAKVADPEWHEENDVSPVESIPSGLGKSFAAFGRDLLAGLRIWLTSFYKSKH